MSCPYAIPSEYEAGKYCETTKTRQHTGDRVKDSYQLCFSYNEDYTKCPNYQRRHHD